MPYKRGREKDRYAANRRWIKKHPEAVRKYNAKAYKKRGPGRPMKTTAAERARMYNISKEEAAELLRRSTCDACGSPTRNSRSLHFDHDHVSGRVRGVLCHQCNVTLGMMQDSPERLQLLLNYLIRVTGDNSNDH